MRPPRRPIRPWVGRCAVFVAQAAVLPLVLCMLLVSPAGAAPYTRPQGPPPAATAQPDGRAAWQTDARPFGIVAGVWLRHPAAIVERIGFHQSNHEGARDIAATAWAAGPVLLAARGRLSGRFSAADIVVPRDAAILAPVTGTVLRAGSYVLYCEHADDFVVIAPDSAPHLEVKLLHIDGVVVAAGDRVVSRQTVLAPRATVLPFASQVDATTATPSWPHVHLEVVDPRIENVPNGGSGSSC